MIPAGIMSLAVLRIRVGVRHTIVIVVLSITVIRGITKLVSILIRVTIIRIILTILIRLAVTLLSIVVTIVPRLLSLPIVAMFRG